jgi:hypothetical protein
MNFGLDSFYTQATEKRPLLRIGMTRSLELSTDIHFVQMGSCSETGHGAERFVSIDLPCRVG